MGLSLSQLAAKQKLTLKKPEIKPTPRRKKLQLLKTVAESETIAPEALKPIAPKTSNSIVIQRRTNRLVDDDFPFDESQLAAIEGLSKVQYGVLTGAAGTGKTTCTKKLIDELVDSTKSVDMNVYFKDEHAESEGNKFVAGICLCAFTGKATEQIKKNFPADWHSNIMTIHRMLSFAPEYYDDIDEQTGGVKKKMRFVPRYTKKNKLPWSTIVIDEGGMLGIDLWHQVLDACPSSTRIIMIGDINQLPPVQGNSIFGFASIKWPAWELNKIHRQKGEHNPIVENAWRILNGKMPEKMPNFNMIQVDGMAPNAAKQFRAALIKLEKAGIYDPIRDTGITATNGLPGTNGEVLGQIPMNEFLAIQFNPEGKRYLIDAGRERRGFACGDKVMVTRNDHERGLTNGMTGVITSIEFNGDYQGDPASVGEVDNLQKEIANHRTEFNADEMFEAMTKSEMIQKEIEQKRGHASHIVVVEFEHGEFAFESFSEVATLQLAYVITGHKSQGSEYPCVVIMVHDAHKKMMNREWLYTVVTRSSEKVILLYTPNALSGAIRKQRITGNNLKEKAQKFIKLMKNPLKAPPRLPTSNVESG